ncbi:hypothetical protein JCM10213_006869 [Rhodosporidiobolus nylandii]
MLCAKPARVASTLACPACTSRAYSAASKARKTRPRPFSPSSSSSASSLPKPPAPSSPLPRYQQPPVPAPAPAPAAEKEQRAFLALPLREKLRRAITPAAGGGGPRLGTVGKEVREPPLVERARQKRVEQRNVFESYLVLPAQTRLYFWLAVGAVGLVGLYGGDWLFPPNEADAVEGEKNAATGEKKV